MWCGVPTSLGSVTDWYSQSGPPAGYPAQPKIVMRLYLKDLTSEHETANLLPLFRGCSPVG